jgi:hypothetical protein
VKGGWFHLEEDEGNFDAGIRNAIRICLAFWLATAVVVAVAWVIFS